MKNFFKRFEKGVNNFVDNMLVAYDFYIWLRYRCKATGYKRGLLNILFIYFIVEDFIIHALWAVGATLYLPIYIFRRTILAGVFED